MELTNAPAENKVTESILGLADNMRKCPNAYGSCIPAKVSFAANGSFLLIRDNQVLASYSNCSPYLSVISAIDVLNIASTKWKCLLIPN